MRLFMFVVAVALFGHAWQIYTVEHGKPPFDIPYVTQPAPADPAPAVAPAPDATPPAPDAAPQTPAPAGT